MSDAFSPERIGVGVCGTGSRRGPEQPPARLHHCQRDPHRDEGIAYAQRLVQPGVPTELHLVPGTFHSSHALRGVKLNERLSVEAITVIQRWLKIR